MKAPPSPPHASLPKECQLARAPPRPARRPAVGRRPARGSLLASGVAHSHPTPPQPTPARISPTPARAIAFVLRAPRHTSGPRAADRRRTRRRRRDGCGSSPPVAMRRDSAGVYVFWPCVIAFTGGGGGTCRQSQAARPSRSLSGGSEPPAGSLFYAGWALTCTPIFPGTSTGLPPHFCGCSRLTSRVPPTSPAARPAPPPGKPAPPPPWARVGARAGRGTAAAAPPRGGLGRGGRGR